MGTVETMNVDGIDFRSGGVSTWACPISSRSTHTSIAHRSQIGAEGATEPMWSHPSAFEVLASARSRPKTYARTGFLKFFKKLSRPDEQPIRAGFRGTKKRL